MHVFRFCWASATVALAVVACAPKPAASPDAVNDEGAKATGGANVDAKTTPSGNAAASPDDAAAPGDPGDRASTKGSDAGTPPPANPCAAVLCGPPKVCVANAKGEPTCVAPEASTSACLKSGCGGTVCSDKPVFSTCMYRPEHACYASAICEKNAKSGACGWRMTTQLEACLKNPPKL